MRTARRIKNIIYWTLGFFLGIGLLFGGIVTLNSHGTVDCGGEQMQSGDQCVETDKYGHQTVRSMDEQKSDNTRTGWALVVLGPLLSVGMVFLLRSELRRRPGGSTGFRMPNIPAMGGGSGQMPYNAAYPQPGGPIPQQHPMASGVPAGYAPQPYAPSQGQPFGAPQAPYGQSYPQQQAYPQPGGYPQQQSGYPPQGPQPGQQSY